MKKIKIIKHIEIIYEPDIPFYDDMPIEEIAKEDVRILTEYGETFFIMSEGEVEENKTITWEIIEEDGKSS